MGAAGVWKHHAEHGRRHQNEQIRRDPGDHDLRYHAAFYGLEHRPVVAQVALAVVTVRRSTVHARPVRMAFQYNAGSPRLLRNHMSRRSRVVSISGIEGAGCIV